jgi:hypothetical protein
MSTLDIHRSTSALPAGLTRFVALLNAQRHAAAARKRYPFAEWAREARLLLPRRAYRDRRFRCPMP